jgi:hypothetical protein
MAKAKTKSKVKEAPDGPKAKNDSYVMMLFITFASVLTGCLMLHLDYAGTESLGIGEDKGYGSKTPPKDNPPPIPKLGESFKIEVPPADAPKTPDDKGMPPMPPMGGMPPMPPMGGIPPMPPPP